MTGEFDLNSIDLLEELKSEPEILLMEKLCSMNAGRYDQQITILENKLI